MPRLRDATRLGRRRAFIDAAWRRAASQGWRDMTVDDVCAEAGLSKGAFYTHFDSKQSLLHALIVDGASWVSTVMDGLEAQHQSGTDRLRTLSRLMLERAEDPARVRVLTDLWAAALRDPDIRQHLGEAIEADRRVIRRWVEEATAEGELVALPANALASILLALNDGLMLHRALDESGFRWANISRALDALLAGVRSV
jgi:AcrR family transcriptional regulator